MVDLFATIYLNKPIQARLILKQLVDTVCKYQVIKTVINYTSKTLVPKILTMIIQCKKEELLQSDKGSSKRFDLLVSRKSVF